MKKLLCAVALLVFAIGAATPAAAQKAVSTSRVETKAKETEAETKAKIEAEAKAKAEAEAKAKETKTPVNIAEIIKKSQPLSHKGDTSISLYRDGDAGNREYIPPPFDTTAAMAIPTPVGTCYCWDLDHGINKNVSAVIVTACPGGPDPAVMPENWSILYTQDNCYGYGSGDNHYIDFACGAPAGTTPDQTWGGVTIFSRKQAACGAGSTCVPGSWPANQPDYFQAWQAAQVFWGAPTTPRPVCSVVGPVETTPAPPGGAVTE